MTPVLPFGEGYRLLRLHELYPEGAQLGLDAVRQEIRERLLTEQSQRGQSVGKRKCAERYQPLWVTRNDPVIAYHARVVRGVGARRRGD